MLLFQLTFFQLAFLRFGEWSWFTQMKTQPKFWLHACKLERAEPETKKHGENPGNPSSLWQSKSKCKQTRGFQHWRFIISWPIFCILQLACVILLKGFTSLMVQLFFFAKKSPRDFGRIAYIAHAIWSNGRFVAWCLAFFQDCWPKGNSIFITYTGTTFVSRIAHVGPSMSKTGSRIVPVYSIAGCMSRVSFLRK